MPIKPILNFKEDLKAYFSSVLSRSGYDISDDADLHSLGIQFFNVQMRSVEPRKRKILESRAFRCPRDYESRYSNLKRKIVAGENINAYLSKTLFESDYQDTLLWDWGIHHFHLGHVIDQREFVSRTGVLLFARVTDDTFYALAILDHTSFSDQKLVKIIHGNCPTLMEPLQVKGILSPKQNYTNEDVKKLRKAGIQTLTFVEPDVVCAPLGGGYSMAGTSVRVQMEYDKTIRKIRQLEKWVIEHSDDLYDQIHRKGLVALEPLRFTLSINEKGIHALEEQSNVAFLLERR